jgi:hypothetical protein
MMNSKPKVIVRISILILTGSFLTGIQNIAIACGPGEGRGISVNATTGEQITYCIPAAPTPGIDYNPQTNPNAPAAETTMTREQAAADRVRMESESAAAAAAERARIAANAPASAPAIIDPLDPVPGLNSGDKVPGTTISGQADFNCPTGTGKAVEVNATTGNVSSYCVKNWVSPTVIAQKEELQQQIEIAKEEALALSMAWNAENPGKQKCFSYGVFTDANGGTQSGGVCANPVGINLNSELIEILSVGQSATSTATFATQSLIPKTLLMATEDQNVLKLNSLAGKIQVIASKPGKSNINLKVTTDDLGAKIVNVPDKLAGYKIVVKSNNKILTSTQLGATTYFSDGSKTTKMGVTTYSSSGVTRTSLGTTSYSSTGVVSTTIGSTTYRSTGVTSQKIGTTTYYSNGQIYQSLK